MDEKRDLADDIDFPNLLCEEQEELEERNNNYHADDDTEGEEDKGVTKSQEKKERAEKVVEKINGDGVMEEENEDEEVVVTCTEYQKDLEMRQEASEMGVRIDSNAATDKATEKDTCISEKDDQIESWKEKDCMEVCKESEIARDQMTEKSVREGFFGGKTSEEVKLTETTLEDLMGMMEPTVSTATVCDLSDSGYLSCGTGLYCPPGPASSSLFYPPQPQLAPSDCSGVKCPQSPQLSDTFPMPAHQPLQVKVAPVYTTRRSIRFNTKGRGHSQPFAQLSGATMGDSSLLPPVTKKKSRTFYSNDQLEHLENLFQDDHYPDTEKRKDIAVSVGVTPQRIMVWFQNRRAKWRKAERTSAGKQEHKLRNRASGSSSSPTHNPTLALLAPQTRGGKPFLGHLAPLLTSAAPPLPPTSTASYSTLLGSFTSPTGSSRAVDGGPSSSSQGGIADYHPPPMVSPPPLRRATFPFFSTPFNSSTSNPAAPFHSTQASAPTLFVDSMEGSYSLPQPDLSRRDAQPLALQSDSSCLFDYGEKQDFLTSNHQRSSHSYQLETSYPASQLQAQNQAQHQLPAQFQPKAQAQTSLPRLAYLTPSPYLTANNPPDSNPTSYLTFGPEGGSGMVTYAAGGHAYFQPQSAGQIVLRPAGHHGGVPTYQAYPWNEVYSQPAMFQRAQCSQQYPSSLGATREHQPPSASAMLPPTYYPRPANGPSHLHTQSHLAPTQTQTHMAAPPPVLPPISSLRPSRLRVDSAPPKSSLSPPSQLSPTSPDGPLDSTCVKMEFDSPREIHSHFHCEFSPIHF